MAADVVPVDVGGNCRHRQGGKFFDLCGDIAEAQAGVDEQSFFCSAQEVAVGLLPVAVFAEDEGFVVDPVKGKPGGHRGPPFLIEPVLFAAPGAPRPRTLRVLFV